MSKTERLGQWLVPVTLCSLLLFPLAVVGFRISAWGFSVSFMLIQLQALLTLLIVIFGLVLLVAGLRQGNRSQSIKGAGVLSLAAVVIFLLAGQVYKAKTHPFIHDITTDTLSPPQFNVVAGLRENGDHSTVYEGESVAEQQRQEYGDILPIEASVDAAQAYNYLKIIIQSKGWQLVADEPERGHLEAVDSSLLFGFKDDVVIRVQGSEQGVRIDIRSASRIGRSDLGANADRIRYIREAFEQSL